MLAQIERGTFNLDAEMARLSEKVRRWILLCFDPENGIMGAKPNRIRWHC